MKKGIFTTLVVFWCGLIFWFSAQPAVESAKMSHSVGKVIGEVLVPDFKTLSAEEQEKIKEQVEFMKTYREVLQFGTFYRLQSPFKHNTSAC